MSAYEQPPAAEERGSYALFLAPGVHLLPDDVEAGFRWLSQWDVLMPLRPYDQLARDFGDEQERTETRNLVIHLAQPVYDERIIFLKRDTTAEDLIAQRREETCNHDACPLPMLRAIWKTKPLLLALAAGWVQEGDTP